MKRQLTKVAEEALKRMIRDAKPAPLATIRGGIPPHTKCLDRHPLVYVYTYQEGKMIGIVAYTGRWGLGPANDIAYGPGKLTGCETYINTDHKADDLAGAYAAFAESLEAYGYPADEIVEGLHKWGKETDVQYALNN